MKKGISSNGLKIIAIIIMIIDHIGLYLYNDLSQNTYYLLRSIGRMAMPIFVYLIIQGFFYTKNLIKYILRIFILATVTQIVLMILGYINEVYYPNYWIGVNNYLGVLYSYTLSLILLAVIDKKTILKNLTEKQNLIIRINIAILVAIAYLKLKLEFDMRIPFMFLEIYAIEKLFSEDNILYKKSTNRKPLKEIAYIFCILIVFALSLIYITYTPGSKYVMLASIVFIALYNGERGKSNEFIKYLFYLIFPLQHLILYLVAMI